MIGIIEIDSISAALRRPDTTDPGYLKQWRLLMIMVSVLWRHRESLGEEEFVRQRAHVESWCDRLLGEERTQPRGHRGAGADAQAT